MRVRLRLDNLIEIITRSSLSQNHWAAKIGISRGHLSGILNGRHPYPSPLTRQKMLDALGVGFEELFDLEEGDAWVEGSRAQFQAAIAERYLVDRELGHGGMGTVFLARDVKLGRLVALKVINPEVVSGIGVQQFLKEIRYTARLEHPNILTLHDAGEAAGYPYYVMPYIRGGSLRERLQREGRLGRDQVLSLTRDLSSALSHAHEHHVVHCDIKPENILLAGEGHAYLADFGISRAVHTEVREMRRRGEIDSSAGTPAYVSPEQAAGEADLDARSDVYSLGCVVFEMLTGCPPFKGATTMEVVSRRFLDPVPDLRELAPEVPASASLVVQRAMRLETQRRFASVREFVESLTVAMKGATVLDTLTSALRPVRHMIRRWAGREGPSVLQRPGKVILTLETYMNDFRFAIRTLTRRPGFALMAILTLGLGVGANTAVFSVVNAFLLRPPPFRDPGTLHHLRGSHQDSRSDRMSAPDFLDLAARSEAIVDAEHYWYGSRNLTGWDEPHRTMVAYVGAGMFSLLGLDAQIGRTLVESDGQPEAESVAVLSDEIWRSVFGADSSVVGRRIEIGGDAYTITGVMPPGFQFPFGGVKMWVADRLAASADRDRRYMLGVIRARDGVERAEIQRELDRIAAGLERSYPDTNLGSGFFVEDLRYGLMFLDDIVRALLGAMALAVAMVLLIACANVANMMLARANSREREIAVRAVLGASRGRIVRQLLTEGALVALVAGLLGVVLAYLAVPPVASAVPEDIWRSGEISVDLATLTFALLASIGAVLFFGLVPAVRASRPDLNESLKEGGRGGSLRTSRLSSLLVCVEAALAMTLLAVAATMINSAAGMGDIDPGLDPEGVMTAEITLSRDDYPDADALESFWSDAELSVSEAPGIAAAGFVWPLPMNFETTDVYFRLSGAGGAEAERATSHHVTPGYLRAMRIPLLSGRLLEPGDGQEGRQEVLVNRALAERYFAEGSAVGQSITLGTSHTSEIGDEGESATIVGVIADVREGIILSTPGPAIFRPLSRFPLRRAFLAYRAGNPLRALETVKSRIWEIDPQLPVSNVRAMTAVMDESLGPIRGLAGLVTVLAAAALILAGSGIYAIVSYSVSQRTHEFGVRAALGASRSDVLTIVLKRGVILASIGALAGLALTFAGVRLIRGTLFGTDVIGPATVVGIGLFLLAVAVAASIVPALRATRVSPVEALRYE